MTLMILDYGAGNLHSLRKALETTGIGVEVTTCPLRALAGDALVLPGVGGFGAAAEALAGYEEEVRRSLESGLPCLGICLGMQLLFQESEESTGRGIGFLSGSVRRIQAKIVPQMGWNEVRAGNDVLFQGLPSMLGYYANSYVCAPEDSGAVVAWSTYGGTHYPAAVRRGKCWGVQFHPEKSSKDGLALLHNFAEAVQ